MFLTRVQHFFQSRDLCNGRSFFSELAFIKRNVSLDHACRKSTNALLRFALIALGLSGLDWAHAQSITLEGLEDTAWVETSEQQRLNILAQNDHDLFFLLGYHHAKDRFFQMDVARRRVTGELAELLGEGSLEEDFRNRLLNVQAASLRTWHHLDTPTQAMLTAYSQGVNAFLDQEKLPQSYAALFLNQARPWHPLDSIAIMKGIIIQLSLRLDLDRTQKLQDYVAKGREAGFDGQALYFDDTHPTRPISSQTTYATAGLQAPYQRYFEPAFQRLTLGQIQAKGKQSAAITLDPVTLGQQSAQLSENLAHSELWATLMRQDDAPQVGSNWWAVTGKKSATGLPILASDPHLTTPWPGVFYPVHLRVTSDPTNGPMNAAGASFAGVPAIAHGQNKSLVWVSTNNPMDVSDIFLDTLVTTTPDALGKTGCKAASGWCVLSESRYHPVQTAPQSYRVNLSKPDQPDHIVQIDPPQAFAQLATVAFRTYGPILKIIKPPKPDAPGEALVLQYTALADTRELQAFRQWLRAEDIHAFKAALKDFEAGSQNWLVADAKGDLGYFASARLPLRKDLEQGQPIQHGPAFIRPGDGPANWLTGAEGKQHTYLSLPSEALPNIINPPSGLLINANNDPTGMTLDGNLFNQAQLGRTDGSAIYYLNHDYSDGLRAERIHDRIKTLLAKKKRLTGHDLQYIQRDTAAQDAVYLLPKLKTAFLTHCQNGVMQTNNDFTALCNQTFLAEAMKVFDTWDYTMASGIDWQNGQPLPEQHTTAQAALYYHLWRAELLQTMINQPVIDHALAPPSGRHALRALIHRLHASPFTCMGRSGLDFCATAPKTLGDDTARRDYALLAAVLIVGRALDSPPFQAHLNKLGLSSWVWGAVHRQHMAHSIDTPAFSVPGLEILPALLPWGGFPRSGGYESINATSVKADATTLEALISDHGPARRTVAITQHNWFKAEILSTAVTTTARNAQWRPQQMIQHWMSNKQDRVLKNETFMRLRWQTYQPATAR